MGELGFLIGGKEGEMKKLLVFFIILFISFGSYNSKADIIDYNNIGGFGTFKDLNTRRVWLDMDSFFNMSTNDMVAAANVAGFTFATETDVLELIFSLPLANGEFESYKQIMGDAPNRELIWGSYYISDTLVAWAHTNEPTGNDYWQYTGDPNEYRNWDNIPNTNNYPEYTDMNIWAYQETPTTVSDASIMFLLSSSLIVFFGFSRKSKKS